MSKDKKIKLGITGSIGSGKTYISSIFKRLGASVFNSDLVAKECMNTNNELIDNIKSIFGKYIYEDGILNSRELAHHVFNDIRKLEQINNLVHPIVKKKFLNWSLQQSSKILIMESAILHESQSHLIVDKVICVSSDKQSRLNRVMKRDVISKNQVLNIMNKQMQQEDKEKLSDFVIVNDDNLLLLPQIMNVISKCLVRFEK